jgi:ribosomal protein L32
MGAVPKHKISTHRTGRRRKQLKLQAVKTVMCHKCQKPTLPHQLCLHCGADYNQRN